MTGFYRCPQLGPRACAPVPHEWWVDRAYCYRVGGPPRRGVETAARSRGETRREPHRGGSRPAAWPHTGGVGNGYAGRAATAGGAHADTYTTKQDGTAPNEEDGMKGPWRTPLQTTNHNKQTGPDARRGGTLQGQREWGTGATPNGITLSSEERDGGFRNFGPLPRAAP